MLSVSFGCPRLLLVSFEYLRVRSVSFGTSPVLGKQQRYPIAATLPTVLLKSAPLSPCPTQLRPAGLPTPAEARYDPLADSCHLDNSNELIAAVPP